MPTNLSEFLEVGSNFEIGKDEAKKCDIYQVASSVLSFS